MPNKKIKEREQEITELTNNFCDKHLDEDYKQLCERLVKKMGRKHEVPFKRGRLDIWAASVVYAIGSINFLFDQSFEPHMTPDQINDAFGTNKSTVSNKARKIKKMFDMRYFDSEFSTRDMEQSNPFNQMVMVDGFIVPLENLPQEQQEMVRQARAEGKDIAFTTEGG
jgi:hypothetical protein